MIEVREKNIIHYFSRQEDADNYNDYLQNGLKVIRKDNRIFYFNNGDRLIDVSLPAEVKKRYVLHRHDGRKATNEKLLKKYIEAL